MHSISSVGRNVGHFALIFGRKLEPLLGRNLDSADIWMGEMCMTMYDLCVNEWEWFRDVAHGAVEGLVLAMWLSCCWLLHCSCHLSFIRCVMKRERSVFVGRSCGFMPWSEEAAFAALSTLSFHGIPTWEGTQTNEVGELLYIQKEMNSGNKEVVRVGIRDGRECC